MQGECGLAARVGWVLVHGTEWAMWHVCSMEQSALFHDNPKQFLQLVRDAKAAKEPLQFIDRAEVDFDPRPGTLVLLGALICPGLCQTITCDGLFVSRRGSAGREPHTTASNALQWQSLSTQAQGVPKVPKLSWQ